MIVYDGTCVKFQLLDRIGFLELMRETMAITQMLSASAWHLVNHLHCEVDRGDDAKYSLQTTRALRQRLSNTVHGTNDEIIVTVLALAVHAVSNAVE